MLSSLPEATPNAEESNNNMGPDNYSPHDCTDILAFTSHHSNKTKLLKNNVPD